jgi:hypothetical protein
MTTAIEVVATPPETQAPGATPPTVRVADPNPPAARLHPITAWVATGVGTAGIGSQDGDAFRIEVALAAGIHLFSLRYVYALGTSDGCGLISCAANVSLPANSVNELALQYGIKERIPYLLATASVGVSESPSLWPPYPQWPVYEAFQRRQIDGLCDDVPQASEVHGLDEVVHEARGRRRGTIAVATFPLPSECPFSRPC